jgi:hypothetical protein
MDGTVVEFQTGDKVIHMTKGTLYVRKKIDEVFYQLADGKGKLYVAHRHTFISVSTARPTFLIKLRWWFQSVFRY